MMYVLVALAIASFILSAVALAVAVHAARGLRAVWDYLDVQQSGAKQEQAPRELRREDMTEAQWLRSQYE
jgi:cell division protein FtsB